MFFILAYIGSAANILYVGGFDMKIEDKKTLINNFIFLAAFALVFAVGCLTGSEMIADMQESKSASVDLEPKKVIVIDPGHGGEDGGAIGVGGVLEKDLNLALSSTISEILRFSGFEVIETRTEDVMLYDKNVDYKGKKKILDLAARLETANSTMPDLFLGIHMNSFPDSRYSGLTVYYSENTPESFEIAEFLRQDVVSLLQPDNNRVLKPGGNIYLLKRTACPAILVECGFVSNPEECALLSTEDYRQRLSFVIYSSLSSNLSGN